ncbi:hypothetical protein POM88_041314 [Heracleum sosnowskyi]|uniref:Uncharacterized protein n=1 Tax=Heracleum sosnowskyi TaxID=360622 RepID=A0AAD8HFN6_9APIA|nr:hypothetical protein POM88_041314 [Heracleum sosnowskyi]
MAATHFPASTNKNLTNDGIPFVINNFSAILNKTKAPSEFHLIQDFLASSPIGYALTEPKAISAQAVTQIWSSATYTPGTSNTQHRLTFSYRNDLYEVTPAVVQRSLHLGSPTSFTPFFSEAVLREFFTKIGYNGDMTRMGKLNTPRSFQEYMLKGRQMFQGDVVYPEQVRRLLRQRLPTIYGLVPSTLIQRFDVDTPSGSNPSTQPKQSSKHSIPTSDSSQQQSVVRHTRLAKSVRHSQPSGSRTLLPHPTDNWEKQGAQAVGMASKILASRRKHTNVIDSDTDEEDDDDNVPLSSIFKISSADVGPRVLQKGGG